MVTESDDATALRASRATISNSVKLYQYQAESKKNKDRSQQYIYDNGKVGGLSFDHRSNKMNRSRRNKCTSNCFSPSRSNFLPLTLHSWWSGRRDCCSVHIPFIFGIHTSVIVDYIEQRHACASTQITSALILGIFISSFEISSQLGLQKRIQLIATLSFEKSSAMENTSAMASEVVGNVSQISIVALFIADFESMLASLSKQTWH